MKNWHELKSNYYGSRESGSKQLLPVIDMYVDVTTGEVLNYKLVHLEGKYRTINAKTQYYDDIINQRFERTVECEPSDTD